MAKYNASMGGAAILADVRRILAAAPSTIAATAMKDELPADHRRRVRTETIANIRTLVGDANRAFNEWVEQLEADARKVLASDPVRSPAEETRALRNELEFDRLVNNAKANDTPRNVGRHYLGIAEEAYLDGEYERAKLHARAAVALGIDNASRVLGDAQTQLDLDIPERASALRDIETAKRARMTFNRDVMASMARVLDVAGDAADLIGDDPRGMKAEATRLSMAAKGWALDLAHETGTEYAPPEGSLASAPAAPVPAVL